MRPFLLPLLVMLCINITHTQTVSVTSPAGCFAATFDFTFDADNSPDGSGRNVYFYSNSSLEIRFNTGANRWEIRARGGNFDVYYINTFASSPNPPDGTTSPWEDFGFCDNTGAPTVSGDGTQSTLGGDPCANLGGDSDGDGVCDDSDICPGSDDNADQDGDEIPDGCDPNPTVPDGVLVDAQCLDPSNPIIYLLSGTDATGRNIYSSTNTQTEVRYSLASGRWELRAQTPGTDIYLYNDFDSYPDPPGSAGTWVGTSVLNCNTAPTPTVTGSGTQNTLGCTISINTLNPTPSTCNNDGSITISALGAHGQVTYFISGPSMANNTTGTFTMLPAGMYNVTISDGAFPSGVCEATSTTTINLIPDVQMPIATCPGTQLGDMDMNCQFFVPDYTSLVTASDNCSSSPTIVQSPVPATMLSTTGTTSILMTVSDDNSNMSTCSFNLTLSDPNGSCNTAPMALCQSISVPVGSDCTVSITASQVDDGSFDPDNDPLFLSLDNSGPFTIGDHMVTLTASDGNLMSSCMATVSVSDDTDPLITCPGNIQVASDPGQCGTTVSYTPPAGTDNCPGATTSLMGGLGSGAFFPVGTTLEIYTVTDAAGNTDQCTIMITIEDNEAPSISCPSNIQVVSDPGQCGTNVNYVVPIGTDNCPGAVTEQTQGRSPNTFFPVGTTLQTYLVSDAAGLTNECSFMITVVDNESPSITCPENIEVSTDPSQCGAIVSYPSVFGTDNCPGAVSMQMQGLGSGASFPVGTTVEAFTVTDAAGLTDECSFMITVLDDEDPIINCPPTRTLTCNPIIPSPDLTLATATDNCRSVMVTVQEGQIEFLNSYFSRTDQYTARDLAGNIDNCSYTIQWQEDDVPPVLINVPDDLVIDCEDVLPPVPDDVYASDENDGMIEPTFKQNVGGSACSGRFYERIWSAIDACGNNVSQNQMIRLRDREAPKLTVPTDTSIELGNAIPEPFYTASDNCSRIEVEYSESRLDKPSGEYTLKRQWIARDGCGNKIEANQVIHIIDSQAPEILISNALLNDIGLGGEMVVYECTDPQLQMSDFTVEDENSILLTDSYDQLVASHVCDVFGYYKKWKCGYIAEDGAGNSSEFYFYVIQYDTTAPVLVGVPSFLQLPCGVDSIPPIPEVTAEDDCLNLVPVYFNEYTYLNPNDSAQFGILRAWRAADECGNETTEIQWVTSCDFDTMSIQQSVQGTIELVQGQNQNGLFEPITSSPVIELFAMTNFSDDPVLIRSLKFNLSSDSPALRYEFDNLFPGNYMLRSSQSAIFDIHTPTNSFSDLERHTIHFSIEATERLNVNILIDTQTTANVGSLHSLQTELLNSQYENGQENKLAPTIYPNPFNSSFTLELDHFYDVDFNIRIYDLMGRLILDQEFNPETYSLRNIIDLTGEKSGLYIIELDMGDKIIIEKIVKN